MYNAPPYHSIVCEKTYKNMIYFKIQRMITPILTVICPVIGL